MADIKWIKITTDIFNDEKMLLIEQMPDADSLLVIWFKLLCLAGRDNNNGIFLMNNRIPYTEEMFATIFRRPLNTIRLALSTFEAFGMIEIDDNIVCLVNWEKHQNIEGMEKIREQSRKRMEDYRSRKRAGVTSVGQDCVYCGKPANAVDHIIPRSKGGQDVAWNLVPCCKNCNSSKKDKDLADFLNDSYSYYYQGIDHELVRTNEKLMNLVDYDAESQKYIQRSVLRNSYAELPDRIDKNKKRKEEDKNRKEKEDTPTVYYPADEVLNQTFLDYIDMRKKIKSPMTDRAITMAIKKLDELSNGDNDVAIRILEESIMNGWKGLFPLKDESRKQTNESVFDEWRNA